MSRWLLVLLFMSNAKYLQICNFIKVCCLDVYRQIFSIFQVIQPDSIEQLNTCIARIEMLFGRSFGQQANRIVSKTRVWVLDSFAPLSISDKSHQYQIQTGSVKKSIAMLEFRKKDDSILKVCIYSEQTLDNFAEAICSRNKRGELLSHSYLHSLIQFNG